MPQTLNNRYPSPRSQHGRLVEEYGAFCQGCGREYSGDPRVLEVDHIRPKSDGGTDIYDNLALLCPPCNRAKGDTMTLTGLQKMNRREGYLIPENEAHLKLGRGAGSNKATPSAKQTLFDREKLTTHYVCQKCGKTSLKNMGRCPVCQAWNSYEEKAVASIFALSEAAREGHLLSEKQANLELGRDAGSSKAAPSTKQTPLDREKLTTHFVCQICGKTSLKELGRCPACQAWNSYEEKAIASASARTPVKAQAGAPIFVSKSTPPSEAAREGHLLPNNKANLKLGHDAGSNKAAPSTEQAQSSSEDVYSDEGFGFVAIGLLVFGGIAGYVISGVGGAFIGIFMGYLISLIIYVTDVKQG